MSVSELQKDSVERTLCIPLWCRAIAVKKLPQILPDVIACRGKYIPAGAHEINMSCDLTDHSWFQEIPFDADKGIIFVAAGVLHYFTYEAVKGLIRDMAESFPGGCFAFDFISEKNLKDAGSKVKAIRWRASDIIPSQGCISGPSGISCMWPMWNSVKYG